MDGVFVYKLMKRLLICTVVMLLCWIFGICADRQKLNDSLIRFHVVANSDSESDQNIKLQVRDAVISSIQSDLQKIGDIEEAKEYLARNIPKIRQIANETLYRLGVEQKAEVTLCKEVFDIRHYDTFSLPAGIYDSLRIVIGDGNGQNWWCVAFPTLCLPATADEFTSIAVDAGLSESLVNTISNQKDYKLRFYFLDKIGALQISAYSGK